MSKDPKRRKFLQGLGTLGAAAALPGGAANAGEQLSHTGEHAAQPNVASSESTTLLFLTRAEADFIDAALSCFIPSDALGPGAKEGGVTFLVLHQFHCDFSLSDGESGFSTFPA